MAADWLVFSKGMSCLEDFFLRLLSTCCLITSPDISLYRSVVKETCPQYKKKKKPYIAIVRGADHGNNQTPHVPAHVQKREFSQTDSEQSQICCTEKSEIQNNNRQMFFYRASCIHQRQTWFLGESFHLLLLRNTQGENISEITCS